MKCRTSLFNPTLSRNLLGRVWPVLVGGTALWLLIFMLVAQGMQYSFLMETADSRRQWLLSLTNVTMVCYVPASILCAVLVLRHMHNGREQQFFLSLPVSRRGVYVTCAVTGFLLLLVPLVLSLGAEMIVSRSMGMGIQVHGMILLAGVLQLLLFYGIAVFSCVLAGHTVGALLIYVGVNCFLSLMSQGFLSMAYRFIHGLCGSDLPLIVRLLTPTAGLAIMSSVDPGTLSFHSLPGMCIYGLIGIGLIVAGGFLYQVRKSERTGSMLGFRWLNGPAKICGASLTAMFLLTVVWFMGADRTKALGATLVMTVFFCILGWFAAEMIVRKTFKVFQGKTILRGALFVLIAVLIVLGIGLDIFHVANRIPDADGLSPEATLSINSRDYKLPTEEVQSIHRIILDHPELETDDKYDVPITVFITYVSKNGTVIRRNYIYNRQYGGAGDSPVEAAILDAIARQKQAGIFRSIFGFDRDEYDMEQALRYAALTPDFNDHGRPYFTVEHYIDFSEEETRRLFQAVMDDLDHGRMQDLCFFGDPESLGYIHFTWEVPEELSEIVMGSDEVVLTGEMTETLKVLEQLGFPLQN